MFSYNAEQIHKLIKAEEYADHLIESAFKNPEELLDPTSPGTKWKSINQRLVELFIEESKKQTHCKQLKNTSHLLDKLVRKEHLNTLVVNLYPGNEGYSLMLRGRNGADSETIRLPYEESELLEYIDAEELPPVLVDLLDKAQANIFYSGCVIVELRDYRRTTTSTCDTRYVLLKPTPHTLICDINSLTNDGHRWTQEDKLNLESQLLLHTNEPLCLDPSPSVFFVANKLNYERQKLNTHAIKQSVKKFSQAAVNRKRKMAQCAAPKHLRLHDFVTKEREKIKKKAPVNPIKLGKPCVDMWRQRDIPLSPPESVEVEQFAKVLEKPKFTFDNTPVNVEEYTLESERSQGKLLVMRLTVQQRLTDDYFLGELYVDRDYMQGQMKGSTCKFSFGTRANVEKYIKQLTEIFTEKGSRSVKITHQVPGQPKMVSYTPAVQATPTSSTPQTPTTTSPATTTTAQATNTTTASQIGAGDASTKHTPPKITIPANTPGGAAATVTNLLSPPAGAPALSPVAGGTTVIPTVNSQGQVQQLTLQQQLVAQQRARQQLGVFTGLQRSVTNPSPGNTPTGAAPQLPTYSQATAMAAPGTTPSSQPSTTSQPQLPSPQALTSHPITMATLPSPTLRTPASSAGLLTAAALTVGARRTSQPSQEGVVGQPQLVKIPQGLLQATSLASYLQGSLQSSSAPSSSTTPTTSGGDAIAGSTTITITTSSNNQSGAGSGPSGEGSGNLVAPNINIAGLAGLPPNINLQNLAGLQGLPNVQVSLANLSMPGGIALPVPLGVISSSQGLNPSILVGSIPGVSTTASSSSSNTNPSQGGSASVTSPPTLVTMVTPIPASSTSTSAVTSGSSTPVVASSGGDNPASVLTSPSNMLSLPIGVTGNLAQFMASPNLKGQSIKGTMPLSLLQLPGQQPVQLVSASLPPGRGPLTATQALQATAQHQQQQQAAGQSKTPTGASSSTSPLSVSSAMLTSPTLPGLTRGQPQTLTAQQLMQLTSHSPQHMAQLFQKPQLQHCQQIQLQQVKPAGSSKSKSKKRTANTSPKS